VLPTASPKVTVLLTTLTIPAPTALPLIVFDNVVLALMVKVALFPRVTFPTAL
jgi:hypothetical protein